MWVCMQNVPANTATGSIARSSCEHRPHREQEHEPPQHRQVRVPRRASARTRRTPRVSTASTRADAEHAARARRAGTPSRARARSRRCRARRSPPEQPERRPAEECPHRPERVEAERARGDCRRSRRTGRCGRPARSAADDALATSRTRISVCAMSSSGYQRGWCSATSATTSGIASRRDEHDDPERIASALRRATRLTGGDAMGRPCDHVGFVTAAPSAAARRRADR